MRFQRLLLRATLIGSVSLVSVQCAPKKALAPTPATGSCAEHLERPAWFAQEFPVADVAGQVARVLRSQQPNSAASTDDVTSLLFVDADLTLLKSASPTLLRDKATGKLFKDPATGLPVLIFQHNSAIVRERYQKEHPGLSLEIDYSEDASVTEILRTPPIEEMVAVLRAVDRIPSTRQFIITARSSPKVVFGLEAYLLRLGVSMDGIFAVNEPDLVTTLGIERSGPLTSSQRKSVVMGALIALHPKTRSVDYYDDSDDNLKAAMSALPGAFPEIDFTFIDPIYRGADRFEQVVVARGRGAHLARPTGEPFCASDIAAYKSLDAPHAVDPALDGPWTKVKNAQ